MWYLLYIITLSVLRWWRRLSSPQVLYWVPRNIFNFCSQHLLWLCWWDRWSYRWCNMTNIMRMMMTVMLDTGFQESYSTLDLNLLAAGGVRRYLSELTPTFWKPHFYRTRVRSLGMLVTNWLTESLTHCRLVNLIDVTLACEDENSNLLRLLLLLMLMMRIVLTTVWCRFGRWFGHKVKFLFRLWAQGFKVWSIFWSWCSGKILKLKFGHCFAADTSCGYEVQSWSRFWR